MTKVITGRARRINLSFYTTNIFMKDTFPAIGRIWESLCKEFGKTDEKYYAHLIDETEIEDILANLRHEYNVNVSPRFIDTVVLIKPKNKYPDEDRPTYNAHKDIGSFVADVLIPFRALALQRAIMQVNETISERADIWFEIYVEAILRLAMGYIILHEKHKGGTFAQYYEWLDSVDLEEGLSMVFFDLDVDLESPAAFFDKIKYAVDNDPIFQEIMELGKVTLKDLALVHGMCVYPVSSFHDLGISGYWGFDEFHNRLYSDELPPEVEDV